MEPVNNFNYLNSDLLSFILGMSTPKDLSSCSTVCEKWGKAITPAVWREVIGKCIAFGSNEYKQYFKWNVKHVELPLTIRQDMMDFFNFSDTNGVTEIPMLVLIDPRLTLKKIGELVQPFLGNSQNGYDNIWPELLIENGIEKEGDGESQKPYWVLLMNGNGVGRFKDYNVHRDLIELLNEDGLQVPTTEEAVACIYAKYVVSEMCKFNQTYTRTQNMMGQYKVIVGGFRPPGLSGFSLPGLNVHFPGLKVEIAFSDFSVPIGIAAMRKLVRGPCFTFQ